MPQDEIQIGKLIKDKLKEDGRSASWLAEKICCDRTNIYKIFKKSSINASLLQKISRILGVDFFTYYSDNNQNINNSAEEE